MQPPSLGYDFLFTEHCSINCKRLSALAPTFRLNTSHRRPVRILAQTILNEDVLNIILTNSNKTYWSPLPDNLVSVVIGKQQRAFNKWLFKIYFH